MGTGGAGYAHLDSNSRRQRALNWRQGRADAQVTMRAFTRVVSALLSAVGVRSRPPARDVSSGYRLVITADEVACEHFERPRESIRWQDVQAIWYVTTSDGPWQPDEWLLLEGEHGGCSFPTEAAGFEGMWDEIRQRFTGFDYGPMIRGGITKARHLCWERRS